MLLGHGDAVLIGGARVDGVLLDRAGGLRSGAGKSMALRAASCELAV